MTDTLMIFLLTGLVSMSAALSAGTLNKLPEDKRPDFLKSRNGPVTVIMIGNFAALTLIGALAFGFRKLDWWIPLTCIFLTFPVVHILILQRLLGNLRNLFLMAPLVLVSIVVLYLNW
ncbi:hypothetical protein [Nitrincola alkalilacustris]|uniref:hypothetical protein n=1 Tax=Nitrincola alkalilacustris TaxID=1571224 RepID=UPI00124E6822|nr:hypothetical protein [Nitrincola alkalilacustris]